MLKLKREIIIEKLGKYDIDKGCLNHFLLDLKNANGSQAISFLAKKGDIKFPKKELEKEINNMVEKDLITIGQWESLLSILNNTPNGSTRVLNFLKKKQRIVAV